jgi:hypothetical protein
MGIFGEATDSILRLPKVLCVIPAGIATVQISAGQLDTVLNQAENVTLKAKALVVGRSQTDLTISLEPASWSVAQCFDHLAQTTNAFLPGISTAITRAPCLTTNRALRTGALTRLFIRNLEPPYKGYPGLRKWKNILELRSDQRAIYMRLAERTFWL